MVIEPFEAAHELAVLILRIISTWFVVEGHTVDSINAILMTLLF